MKPARFIAFLIAAVSITPGVASAHVDTVYDSKNNTEIDLKRASISHSDNQIFGQIATHGNVSDYLLKKRGFFRFHVWEAGKAGDGVYAIAIFRNDDGLKARIFKLQKNKDAKQIGMGTAKREAKDEFSFAVSRSKLTFADETRVKWTMLGYWCPNKECDNPRLDWIPNAGSEGHFLS